MPSEAPHLMFNGPQMMNILFKMINTYRFAMEHMIFLIKAIFVVLMKTLYAFIQQHSDSCLFWALDMCLFYFKYILDFSAEGYQEFTFYSFSPLKISMLELFSWLVVFAACLGCWSVKSAENSAITCVVRPTKRKKKHPLLLLVFCTKATDWMCLPGSSADLHSSLSSLSGLPSGTKSLEN